MPIATIKGQIKTLLDALVTDTTLNEVQEDDFSENVLLRKFNAYPVAILTTPELESDFETNRENRRTYSFDIVVIQRKENIGSATDIETLLETIVNKFDNNFTLGGSANLATLPASSRPQAYNNDGTQCIYFVVRIQAREVVQLNF